ncbi:MAG TPA: Yip1 family protein [Gaiellaceae bacterium]|nr:Yip1 family protein [Gaiellaceae bacterium]
MSADAPARDQTRLDRAWWLRTLAVFQSPRAVFAALRADGREDLEARQEPVLALVLLAGIAGVLVAPSTGRLLDESLVDNSMAVVAVLVFITGTLYGTATYWIGGAALYFGLRGAGSRGSYLRARHVLAYAAAPLVVGLVLVWPVRLAVYGSDVFRTGGEDDGAGNLLFDAILAVIGLWAVGLLIYGISVVERWSIVRAIVSVGLVVLSLLVITFPFLIPLASR